MGGFRKGFALQNSESFEAAKRDEAGQGDGRALIKKENRRLHESVRWHRFSTLG
jgi:hypothetical protein